MTVVCGAKRPLVNNSVNSRSISLGSMADFVRRLSTLKSQYLQLRLHSDVPCKTMSSTGLRPLLGKKAVFIVGFEKGQFAHDQHRHN
jgi:hypothetical protein